MDRKRLQLALELGINLALPWLAYTLAEPHWGELGALLAAAAPPLLWSLFELARRRRIDMLSLIVLLGIALSLGGLALGGEARILLVRESLVGALVGLSFLVSLLFNKPLIYYLARAALAREEDDAGKLVADWWETPGAREAVRTMTAVWGLGLSAEAGLRVWLAWNWEPKRFLALAPLIGYALLGLLLLWTLWFQRRLAKRWDAEDAARAASAAATPTPTP